MVGLSILFCSFAFCFLLTGTHRVHSTPPTDIQVVTNIQDESGAITESGIPLYMSLKSMCKNFSIISACMNLLVVIQILSHSYNISSFANPMLEELLHSHISPQEERICYHCMFSFVCGSYDTGFLYTECLEFMIGLQEFRVCVSHSLESILILIRLWFGDQNDCLQWNHTVALKWVHRF